MLVIECYMFENFRILENELTIFVNISNNFSFLKSCLYLIILNDIILSLNKKIE